MSRPFTQCWISVDAYDRARYVEVQLRANATITFILVPLFILPEFYTISPNALAIPGFVDVAHRVHEETRAAPGSTWRNPELPPGVHEETPSCPREYMKKPRTAPGSTWRNPELPPGVDVRCWLEGGVSAAFYTGRPVCDVLHQNDEIIKLGLDYLPFWPHRFRICLIFFLIRLFKIVWITCGPT